MSDSFRSELLGPPIESAGPDPVQPLAPSSVPPAPTQDPSPDSGRSMEAGLPDLDRVSEATEVQWDGVPRPAARPTSEKRIPLLGGRRKGRRLIRRDDSPRTPFTPEQRLLILDSW